MQKRNGKIIYSPSDLIRYMESPYASWMDRYYLEFPEKVKPDAADEQLKSLQKRGIEHEKRYLESLKQASAGVRELTTDDSHATTLAAMKEGAGIIYQGRLVGDDGFEGFSDFLVKVDGPSELGDFTYQPFDTKLALKPKPYFIIQLCCYAEMLAAAQGVLPQQIAVVLGNCELKYFRTADYFYYYKTLKNAFLRQQESFDENNPPEPSALEDCGRWTSYAESYLIEHDHLSLVANVRATQIKKLKSAGINTVSELAISNLEHVKDMEPATLATLKQQARLQVASRGLSLPLYELIPQDGQTPRRGLSLLPPASMQDVFFDMEGYPHVEGGLEYLFGVTYLDDGEPEFKDWWAHNRDEERQAFAGFIDWVHGRWQQDRAMHIYHYGSYEITALRKLMGRYGTRELLVDELLRNQVFVDLLTVVRQGLRVGEPSYSIKNIEHLYREKRKGEVAKASDSIVFYERWLEEKDGDNCQTSKILKDIRNYNQDDCDSTWQLARWLGKVQSDSGIKWVPPEDEEEREESDKKRKRREASELAAELLATLPDNDTDRRRLQELLAHLLEFHWREERPMWWAMFDRHEMSEQELIDDIDCLGGLKRTAKAPAVIARSISYEYQYNPEQDTKLKEGDKCFFAHDLKCQTTIVDLDEDKGLVSIKIGPGKPAPPEKLGLIPNEHVPADKIADSIYRTVLAWKNDGKLPPALADFLLRKRPRIAGNSSGKIIASASGLRSGAIETARKLDKSTLCIQGPPGGGKTTTGAAIIVELLRDKKIVGITSNSHKAIINLLQEVAEQAKNKGVPLNAVKLGDDKSDPIFNKYGISHAGGMKDIASSSKGSFQLIAGTAWAFSDESAQGLLDYLFVDEAGQVSVANLAGMAPSTKNIILLGDQMQLGQPMKGAHPGESGESVLDYLLGEHQVIAEDFGIFLGTTYRMHPDVCRFISAAVYEDRLQPDAVTAKRVLEIPATGITHITCPAGLMVVPVAHEGNTQGSDEEAAMVADLVNELLLCRVKGNDGVTSRPLTLSADDILIVCPYNMQAGKIKSRLPLAHVASVDKFQGKQASVVIVSMCASSAADSPRGLEFLFNKNRLNVAISRAQTLAIVVASPALANASCSNIEQMKLTNLFSRIQHDGRSGK